MKPLVIIPTYLTAPNDVEVLAECIGSVRRTEEDHVDILLVDDCSPARGLLDELEGAQKSEWAFEVHRNSENQGFSRTVNIGLQRCLDEGRDAILMNADIEMTKRGWLGAMQSQRCVRKNGLASVVGAKLVYPTGLIQHAGIYFSLLARSFDHIYKYGPRDLPEANVPRACPVTGALQFIRHECLTGVGLYDPEYRMAWEDVDYCVRVWLSGRECVYQPAVEAYHFESMFRGRGSEKINRWVQEGWLYFMRKWGHQSFAELVPGVFDV